jgi:hypothetical protein
MILVHLGKSVTTIEDWNVQTLWGGMKVVLIVNTMCHKHKIYHNQGFPTCTKLWPTITKTSLNLCSTINHNSLKQGCATYARIQT